MTATETRDDDNIEWRYEPTESCEHTPVPATIESAGLPVGCPKCGASGTLPDH